MHNYFLILTATFWLASWTGCGPRGGIPAGEAASHAATPPGELGAAPSPAPAAHTRVAPTYNEDVAPLLERYCLDCHGSGGVILDAGRVPGVDDRPTWLRVAEALRAGGMPPEGEPRPGPEELETINAWLDVAVFADEPANVKPALRRLNRAEYNNTIRDLTGLDLRPADDFPSDDVGYGFDNIGEVLSTSPILVERCLDAADRVIDAVFRSPEARRLVLEPPADSVPRAFRRFRPPVRSYPDKRTYAPRPVARDPELERQQRIYDILRAFADRAFRRPATHDELIRLLGIVLAAEKDGESPEAALRLALRSVLVSPYFLFHAESVLRDDPSGLLTPENDVELAARLSYFLWSSVPDEELSRLAVLGKLRLGDNLAAQARRMLRDPKSRAGGVFREPVAPDPQAQGPRPRPRRLPRLRRAAEGGDADGDRAVLRVGRGGGPERPGFPRRGRRVRQRAARAALRDRGRRGRLVPPGLPGRYPAGGCLDPGERPDGDVEPDADLAGQAGQVDFGE
jgi:hypothetical protein